MELIRIKEGIRRWIAIYLGAVSCILIPLFMRHGYYTLIYWKSRVYLFAAVPAVAVAVLAAAAEFLSKLIQRSDKAKSESLIKKPPVSVILLLSIAV